MANGGGYDYTKYESYSQDPEFRRLQTAFSSLFGSSFPTFSWEAFTSDPEYAKRIYGQIQGPRESDKGAMAARTQALNALEEYFTRNLEGSTFDKSGGKIDVESIFGPLKDEIKALTEQQIRLGRGEISREAGIARDIATESLAGTGLGRSGVAAGQFQGIETRRAELSAKLGQETRIREAQALLAVDKEIAEKNYTEELRKRGMNEQDIRDSLSFYRDLQRMQYETMLQMAAQDDGSFWDNWGGVFQTVAGIGTMAAGVYTSNPALIAAGGSMVGG